MKRWFHWQTLNRLLMAQDPHASPHRARDRARWMALEINRLDAHDHYRESRWRAHETPVLM